MLLSALKQSTVIITVILTSSSAIAERPCCRVG